MTERPGAESLIARASSELQDVHAYAINELAVLENLINRVKLAIEQKKNDSILATRTYVESVDEAIRAARGMEEMVLAIAKAAGVDPVTVQGRRVEAVEEKRV